MGGEDDVDEIVARALVDRLTHDRMREDFAHQVDAGGAAWAIEMLEDFFAMDDADQRDVEAFHDSGGPNKLREFHLRKSDGTPTSGDLEKWAQEG